MNYSRTKSRAGLIAKVLGGAWRNSPPELKSSLEEVSEVAPLLLGSGAGALAWWRVRHTTLQTTETAREFHEAYLLHTIHGSLFAYKTRQAISLLRSNGIEPILIKGWAIARHYPERGLRPYGDIDLCVRPDQYTQAKALLDMPEYKDYWVDLHEGLSRYDNGSWDELFGRSQLVKLDEISVRVLADEDHLRVLCVHWLSEGAWRPILLCDIAAVVESMAENFDWDICLGEDSRRAKWIASTIGLAHHLLDADIKHCPLTVRNVRLPDWLVATVLRQWETPNIQDHRPPESIMKTLRHPLRVPKALVRRWPDPIGATIRLKGSFNQLPRLPFQIGDYFLKHGRFLMRLPGLVRARR
jgi:hypothetical protein